MKPFSMFLVLCIALLAFSGAMIACKEECPPCEECEPCPEPTPVVEELVCPPKLAQEPLCDAQRDWNCYVVEMNDAGEEVCAFKHQN